MNGVTKEMSDTQTSSMPESREPYRVVVWGPGYTGSQALREISRRPELELVGCLAYNQDKVGRDAMELVGERPVGVQVTDRKDVIYDLDADIVLYAGIAMRDESSRHEEITQILRSGKNVATTTAYFFPWQRGPEYVGPLEEACYEGGSTLHGTGVHPGWFVERFALSASGLCTTIQSIKLSEITDVSHHAGPNIPSIGFGTPIERLGKSTRKTLLSRYYFESLAGLSHRLGLGVDRMVADIRYLPSLRDVQCAGYQIAKGTVGCVDATWIGYVQDRPVATIRELWYADSDLVPADVLLSSSDKYEIEIKGLPIDVNIHADLFTSDRRDVFGVDDRQMAANLATAVQLVQVIPFVVAAEPGILVPDVFGYPASDLRTIVLPQARVPTIPEHIL
jgi:hypothetical protein